MPSSVARTEQLADQVEAILGERRQRTPAKSTLVELFDCLFLASLQTDEGRSTRVQIAWVDPKNPDPHPPPRIRRYRWTTVPISPDRRLEPSELVKLSAASDPRSSLITVYGRRNRIRIWGVADQQGPRHELLNREGEAGLPPPGVFQALILGVGHIAVYDGYKKIAELTRHGLSRPPVDALGSGPVRERLNAGIDRYVAEIAAAANPVESMDWWRRLLVDSWLSTLSRILLRIENYRHGGAILLVDGDPGPVNIKYALAYPRLPEALMRRGVLRIEHRDAWTTILREHLHKRTMPTSLYLDESVSEGELDDVKTELDGTTRFISLLTRVDGLVLMDSAMSVVGFGVEIIEEKPPKRVLLARHAKIGRRSLAEVDYNHFGTRHRSMMRYIGIRPDAIGFVVSQDGGVRVFCNVDGDVIMWEDIRLEFEMDMYEILRRRSIAGARSSRS